MKNELQSRPVLFFDGVCNLCHSSVLYVIRHDKKKRFLFSTLQSAAGEKAREQIRETTESPGSVILFYKGKYYTRSAAALHTLKLLGGFRQMFFLFIIVPPFLRNLVYNLIARNRYKWFGTKSECMIPTPDLKARFIEE